MDHSNQSVLKLEMKNEISSLHSRIKNIESSMFQVSKGVNMNANESLDQIIES